MWVQGESRRTPIRCWMEAKCLRIQGRVDDKRADVVITTGSHFVTVVKETGARMVITDNVFADKCGGSNMPEGARAEEPERSEDLMLNPWVSGGASLLQARDLFV